MTRRLAAAAAVLAALAVLAAAHPRPAAAEVNVSVNIGVPSIVVPAPPVMVPVPRTTVYFAPDVDADLYFSAGFWWTPKEGRWFRAKSYNGPWAFVEPRYVPGDVVRIPKGYRSDYARGERVPYGQFKKHWEHREYQRRHHEGDWKAEKRHRKAHEKAVKRHLKEERREHRGDRDDRDDRGGRHGDRGRHD